MPQLDIRLLGPPEILVDGRPLEVDTRKAIAILAVLAADGRPYARDELAALLWPDSDDAAARGALRRTLSTMRSAIGDGPLVIDRSRVDLDRAATRVDLVEIERAARAGDRVALEAAANLARGEFLAGFSLRDSPEFDDWRAARAVAAERAVLAVMDRLAEVAEADGDLPAAISATGRRLDVNPLDESAHVRLMDLLVASGDRGGALRQYRTCVATLERELGVAPLATTTARYEAIRDAASAPTAVAAPTQEQESAPADVRERHLPLVGREAQVAKMLRAFDAVPAEGGQVVAVVGEAGIGKTRLLEEATSRFAARGAVVLGATAYPTERSIAYGPIVDLLRDALDRPDGAERLAGLPSSTRTELARLLPVLDPGRSADDRPDVPGAHARLVAAISDGLTSLVGGPIPGVIRFDDAQWLDAATREAIDALVNRMDRHQVLLLLAWRPEDLDADAAAFASRLADRARTRTVGLERLGRPEIATLVEVAVAQPGESPPSADLIDRLVAASEGLPLYVAAVLGGGSANAPEELPAGVRSVLRERLASVQETTGQILAAASVIGRSFDLETLRHASGRSEEETVDALEQALRRGLVRELSAGYDFSHGALRDLAYEATSLTRRRLLHRRTAEAYRLDLAQSGREDLGRRVLVALHERAAGRDREAAEAYVAAGERAADVFANAEAIEHLSAALALGHHDTVGIHTSIGRLRTRLGDYTGAIEALESAAAAVAADDARLPSLEWALARAHLRRGDLRAADHHLAVAARSAHDDRLRAAIAVDRSALARRRGDAGVAASAAAEALELAERCADGAAVGAAHRMLGLAALDEGDAVTAITQMRAAVAAAESDPDPTASIAALVALALACAATGAIDEALRQGELAVAACRRIGDRHLEAAVENQLADLLHEAGRDDEARPHQLRAMEAFAEVGGDPADPDPGIWMLSVS